MNEMRRIMEAVKLDEVDSRTDIAQRIAEHIQKEISLARRQKSSIAALAEISMNSGNTASAASLENVQGELAQAIRMLEAALADVGKDI